MQIQVNGEATTVEDGLNVATLLQALEISGKRLAVELNGEIVPHARHAEQPLADGDKVEIVHAIGGGR